MLLSLWSFAFDLGLSLLVLLVKLADCYWVFCGSVGGFQIWVSSFCVGFFSLFIYLGEVFVQLIRLVIVNFGQWVWFLCGDWGISLVLLVLITVSLFFFKLSVFNCFVRKLLVVTFCGFWGVFGTRVFRSFFFCVSFSLSMSGYCLLKRFHIEVGFWASWFVVWGSDFSSRDWWSHWFYFYFALFASWKLKVGALIWRYFGMW